MNIKTMKVTFVKMPYPLLSYTEGNTYELPVNILSKGDFYIYIGGFEDIIYLEDLDEFIRQSVDVEGFRCLPFWFDEVSLEEL